VKDTEPDAALEMIERIRHTPKQRREYDRFKHYKERNQDDPYWCPEPPTY
jgi:hypothetical protein